jgi:acetyl-CoA synthetase
MQARQKIEKASERHQKTAVPPANLAVSAVTLNARDRSKIALVWEGTDGSRQVYSFFEIEQMSNRVANVLKDLDVTSGDRIFTLMNRQPALYATIPAILKTGAAAAVLFTDFGAEAIRQRIKDAGAKILISDAEHLQKLITICKDLPSLEHILIIGKLDRESFPDCAAQVHDFDELVENASNEFAPVDVSPDSTCFLIYTSGTTGLPKGVVHRHAIRERLIDSAKSVLSLQKDDFYWCSADAGWVTGLLYGIFAPWLLGFPILIYEGEFDAKRWLEILKRNQVTCFYTTPTLLRLFRNEIGEVAAKKEFALRRIYSAGEPLNPEVLEWAERTFDAQVFDNYWQTETGSLIIAGRPNMPIKRGSMGKAVDGVEVSIIDQHGDEVPNGTIGDIAIRPTLTSLFKGYWNFPEATRVCFRAGWYITRDKGKRDDDGYFWFMARNDDVITCEAQRIGPFEVENALLSHPSIAESAAVGVKDELTTEHVKAFVVLRNGSKPTARLADEIAAHVRTQLSTLAAPREIEFCDDLPKTKSGKIRRDQLRRKGVLNEEKVFIIR